MGSKANGRVFGRTPSICSRSCTDHVSSTRTLPKGFRQSHQVQLLVSPDQDSLNLAGFFLPHPSLPTRPFLSRLRTSQTLTVAGETIVVDQAQEDFSHAGSARPKGEDVGSVILLQC